MHNLIGGVHCELSWNPSEVSVLFFFVCLCSVETPDVLSLQVGDRIIEVNGEPVKNQNLYQVSSQVKSMKYYEIWL